jgi:signal transduction histidine kinase
MFMRPSLAILRRRTVRLRLTLLYGGLFLVSGAALLAVTYALVVHNTQGFIFTGQNGHVGTVVESPKRAAQGPPAEQRFSVSGRAPSGAATLTPQEMQAEADRLTTQARRQHSGVLHQLLVQSAIALAAMALVSLALGWLVAGRVLRPLRTITAAARDISATNLHQRLALDGPPDELKGLADTFDALLARLETAFQAQTRFVANASHELRSPLARQRTVAQVALGDADATVESLRAAHERVLASGAQQERLIEALLTLTRGQAGVERREPFDLASVTDQVVLARVAEAQRGQVDMRAALAPAPAAGDPRLVERLITNLVDNALRHNAPGGSVEVATRTEAGRAVLSVINTGPVVPTAAVGELLQPFKRLGIDRTGHGEGLGLGLSIVEAIAEAHDATLTLVPRATGGLRVEVGFAHLIGYAPCTRHQGTSPPYRACSTAAMPVPASICCASTPRSGASAPGRSPSA